LDDSTGTHPPTGNTRRVRAAAPHPGEALADCSVGERRQTDESSDPTHAGLRLHVVDRDRFAGEERPSDTTACQRLLLAGSQP